jgi:hypothetical protein
LDGECHLGGGGGTFGEGNMRQTLGSALDSPEGPEAAEFLASGKLAAASKSEGGLVQSLLE